MAGVTDAVNEARAANTATEQAIGAAKLGYALQQSVLDQADRKTMVDGIDILEEPNYLRFISVTERQGPGAPSFSIIFDSFLIQRVTRQKAATFDVRYTTGVPVIDVFKDGVELLSVNATLPDTAPFYTVGDGGVTGYLGGSLEALKSVYNRYFRASAAAGSDQNIIGIVEYSSKGRVDRGYMTKLAFERTSQQLDHAEITFDFFVARSSFKLAAKPEELL